MLTMRLLFSSLLLIVLSPFLLAQSKIDLATQTKGVLPLPSMPYSVGTSGPFLKYDVFGSSISSCYYLGGNCYPYLLANMLGENPPSMTYYTLTDSYQADLTNVAFTYQNPSLNSSELTTIESGTWESYAAGAHGGSGPYESVFNNADQAMLSWLAVPYEAKLTAANILSIPSGWSIDGTYPVAPALKSNTYNSSVSWPPLYTPANGVVYIWYIVMDGNGGVFSYSIDGGTPVSVNSYSTPAVCTYAAGSCHPPDGGVAPFHPSITSAFAQSLYSPRGMTQPGTTSMVWPNYGVETVFVKRVTGLSAGSHIFTFTVTSATSTSSVVSIIGIGQPTHLPGMNPVYQMGVLHTNDPLNEPTSIVYNADIQTNIKLLQADGLNVTFVDVRKYHQGIADTTDSTNERGEMALTSGHGYSLYPNGFGHQEIARAFYETIHPAGKTLPSGLNQTVLNGAMSTSGPPIILGLSSGVSTAKNLSYRCVGVNSLGQYSQSIDAGLPAVGWPTQVFCPAVDGSDHINLYRTFSNSVFNNYLLGTIPASGGWLTDFAPDTSCGSMPGCVSEVPPTPNAPLPVFHILTDSLVGTVSLTSGTSDSATVTGATTASHCWLQATNSLAAASNTVLAFPSSVSANTVTITHAATVANGATFNVFCSTN